MRTLVAVLAAAAIAAAVTYFATKPPETPPGYICGPSKMFCKAYPGQKTLLSGTVAIVQYGGDECLGYLGAMLEIEAVSGSQAAATYTPGLGVRRPLECVPGRVIIPVCGFNELSRTFDERAQDVEKLQKQLEKAKEPAGP